ncbi:MAG: GNAT family N-acetyltransferase [Lachnospiraceae bacterium]|jgi:ribosomal-protein-alanine N-acetyltransferase|nr:GNAT family N-acetyltransferase [Lachnospiraceae bacterium]MCI9599562.1 GNAT family N-acetyltransferase [Lachnospiraceae bacterium]MDE6895899.1 GNAT family N-acetyltransferase [Lachnospiraceae bacterium]
MWNETDLDPAFAERDRCRKAGLPVKIAETKRLLIRETVLEDVPKLYEIRQQPGMSDYVEPMQPTLQEEMEFMEAYIHHMYAFYDFGLWTVLERENGRIVGRAGLFPSKFLDEGVELGYMVAAERQRRGYALECGRAILDYASDVLDLPEVHVLIHIRNRASIRTAGRLGFTEYEIIQKNRMEYRHMIWNLHALGKTEDEVV